jgi:hypothetical protein
MVIRNPLFRETDVCRVAPPGLQKTTERVLGLKIISAQNDTTGQWDKTR